MSLTICESVISGGRPSMSNKSAFTSGEVLVIALHVAFLKQAKL